MAIRMGLPYGQQGPVAPGDPDALAQLLGMGDGGGADPSLELARLRGTRADELSTRMATDARVGDQNDLHGSKMLLDMLQGDMAADPSTGVKAQKDADAASQAEYEMNGDLPRQQRHEAQAASIEKLTAPIFAKSQADLTLEGMKDRSAENVARIKSDNPYMDGGAEGAGGEGNVVNYLAQQALRDPSVLTQISDKNLRVAVQSHLASTGGDLNKLTNQTRQMSETANDLLPLIDQVQGQATDLQQNNLFDLVHSPLRQFLVKHGAGSLLGYGADAADKTGRFETDLGLLQSGVARAHAGARGAGNSEIAKRFEQLMGAQGDLPTFLGQLKGVRDLLTIYGKHTGPSAVPGAPDDLITDPNWGAPQQ